MQRSNDLITKWALQEAEKARERERAQEAAGVARERPQPLEAGGTGAGIAALLGFLLGGLLLFAHGSEIWKLRNAARWEAVPARVVGLVRETFDSSIQSSGLRIRYDYEYGSFRRTGEQLTHLYDTYEPPPDLRAMDEPYAALARYNASGETFFAWVNPRDPRESVAIHRVGSWLALGLMSLAGIVLLGFAQAQFRYQPVTHGAVWASLTAQERGIYLKRAAESDKRCWRRIWALSAFLFGGKLLFLGPLLLASLAAGDGWALVPVVVFAFSLLRLIETLGPVPVRKGRRRAARARRSGQRLMVTERVAWVDLAGLLVLILAAFCEAAVFLRTPPAKQSTLDLLILIMGAVIAVAALIALPGLLKRIAHVLSGQGYAAQMEVDPRNPRRLRVEIVCLPPSLLEQARAHGWAARFEIFDPTEERRDRTVREILKPVVEFDEVHACARFVVPLDSAASLAAEGGEYMRHRLVLGTSRGDKDDEIILNLSDRLIFPAQQPGADVAQSLAG